MVPKKDKTNDELKSNSSREEETFENKLSCVSARFTPSNVVLTSLVSLNSSAIFKTLSAV